MEEAKVQQEQRRQQVEQKQSLKEKRKAAQEAKVQKAKKSRHQYHGSRPGRGASLCPGPVLQGRPV